MPKLQDITRAQDAYLETALTKFERVIERVTSRAGTQTFLQLRGQLTLDAGRITSTSANLKALNEVGSIFEKAMRKAGYDDAVTGFVENAFPRQFDFFSDTLDAINAQAKTIQLPAVEFTANDLKLFGGQQLAVVDSLESIVLSVAAQARQRSMFLLGGLSFTDLVEDLTQRFDLTVGLARTLAATSTSSFYRSISERGYEIVQQDLPKMVLLFGYAGPPAEDPVIRPFCRRLMEQSADGKRWTREQIEGMDNGQLANPFISGGGYNCRHQWTLDADKSAGMKKRGGSK
jgi:hypothetical protein